MFFYQTLTSLLAEKICGNIEKVFYGKRLVCQTYVYVNGDILDESTYLDPDVETNSVKEFEVEEGKVFVLGDNREYSLDARYWDDPYVDISQIKGKMMINFPVHLIPEMLSYLFKK